MVRKESNSPSAFEPFATANDFLSDQEIDRLLAEHASLVDGARLGTGGTSLDGRRSSVASLGDESKHEWLYERIWLAAQECNRLFFAADIKSVEANIQLARHNGSGDGLHDWRTDFAADRPQRKLSISIQLSRPEDYDGGELELMCGQQPQRLDRSRGAFIAFPSFVLHRVTPVTRGVRWSLDAWVLGPRWR